MEIKEFLELIEYRNISTDPYLWRCYGDSSLIMDSVSDHGSVSAVFDPQTQRVFQAEAWDNQNHREYRWIDPEYLEDVKCEYKARGLEFENSIDEQKFIDLDLIDDFKEKARAIQLGENYDTRVMVSLDLDKETEIMLMRQAHLADMTVNQYVEHMLKEYIANGKLSADDRE
jgi:hypothetical protein